MKFSHRMLLSWVLPACLFATAVGASLYGGMQTRASFGRFMDRELRSEQCLTEMYAQGLQMGQALRNILIDPANPKARDNLEAARRLYDEAYAGVSGVAAGLPIEQHLDELRSLRQAHAEQQARVLDLAATDPAAAMKALAARETPAWRQLKAVLQQEIVLARELSGGVRLEMETRSQRILLLTLGLSALALLVMGVAALLGRRALRQEIGCEPIDAAQALRRVAAGDLHQDVGARTGLMAEVGRMQIALRELVARVRRSTEHIDSAAADIASGNLDLSSRTEQSASNLQQTASSLEQLTGNVRQTAESAHHADQLAREAQQAAHQGGEAFAQVVTTMDGINEASRRIADIVGVIDGIAFQTNLLALNAAVEAARAGEQGRGFAVVAGEVRGLAQRASDSAHQIKDLINTSVTRAADGARQVADARHAIEAIVASVQRVSGVIGTIAASASQQSEGLGQINHAVSDLDHITQQNSALVEQSAAAAESLKQQADELSELVGTFQL